MKTFKFLALSLLIATTGLYSSMNSVEASEDKVAEGYNREFEQELRHWTKTKNLREISEETGIPFNVLKDVFTKKYRVPTVHKTVEQIEKIYNNTPVANRTVRNITETLNRVSGLKNSEGFVSHYLKVLGYELVDDTNNNNVQNTNANTLNNNNIINNNENGFKQNNNFIYDESEDDDENYEEIAKFLDTALDISKVATAKTATWIFKQPIKEIRKLWAYNSRHQFKDIIKAVYQVVCEDYTYGAMESILNATKEKAKKNGYEKYYDINEDIVRKILEKLSIKGNDYYPSCDSYDSDD